MVTFAVTDVKNRTEAIKKARKSILRKNKDPRGFKPDPQCFKSIRKSPAGIAIGGRKFPAGTHFIVKTRSCKRRVKR